MPLRVFIGRVKKVRTKKTGNLPKGVLPRPGRVLQRRHAFEALAKEAIHEVSVSRNVFDLLIRFTVPLFQSVGFGRVEIR